MILSAGGNEQALNSAWRRYVQYRDIPLRLHALRLLLTLPPASNAMRIELSVLPFSEMR